MTAIECERSFCYGCGRSHATDAACVRPARPLTPSDLAAQILRADIAGLELAMLPMPALAVLAEMADITRRKLDSGVRRARTAGQSWQDIGEQLGVSAQTAQQRWAGPEVAE